MLTVRDISKRLADRSEEVCALLLPGGRLVKGEWICGDLSGGPGKSLHVNLSGEHVGRWRDWADGDQKGDLLDLWSQTRSIPLPDTIREAKSWLGISDPVPIQEKTYSFPSTNGVHDLTPNGRALDYLTRERKLLPEILNRFKIQGQPTSKAIVFPSYSPSGKLINRSYRSLEPDSEGKKKVWQDKGCAPALFGWQALADSAYQSRTVLLSEGQIDAMTWTQWGIPALSIPNGSGTTWIEYEWENLSAFDTIYIAFDMDGSGDATRQKVITRLGKHRCLIVSLPSKDANDCLKSGCTSETAKKWIESSKAPAFKGLILASELESRTVAISRPKPPCFTLPFFQGVWPHTGFYPRPGEVTVWTGMTSHGKSTLLNYFITNALAANLSVFVASMEMKAEVLLRRMICSFLNTESPSDGDVKGFLEIAGSLLVFADVVGYIDKVALFDMMQFSFSRYGTSHFVIDSLMRIEGLEEEFVEQGRFMNQLQEFAKQTDSHIHVVCHPRKMARGLKPEKQDVKGSSLISNNADNIISVNRNYEKEQLRKDGKLTDLQNQTMPDTEVCVEKQRENGWEGKFMLRFNPYNYCYYPLNNIKNEIRPPYADP